MKQLFWKEWRELRFLPLGAALLCFILQFGYYVMCALRIAGERPEDFTLDGTQILAWVLWSFFAILAGSGLISQEVGNGTLSFLFALPTSRRKIWLIKVASGVATLALCAISCSMVTFMIDAATSPLVYSISHSRADVLFSSNAATALLCAVGCFAVSIAVSPLLDRYISAASVSVGTCLVLLIGISMATANYNTPYPAGEELTAKMSYAIVWLCIPVFVVISYWTFTHGETLRSLKRFYAAGRAAIVGVIVFGVLFMFARSYVLAQSASHPRIELSTTVPAPRPGSLDIFSETDSLGHQQYFVQLPSQPANLQLVMEWKIDGGRLSGSSGGALSDTDHMRIGAWLDSSEDTLVKSVLSAQGMAVPHPGDVTFGLHVIGQGDSFMPITLHFKHGPNWSANSSGMSIDKNRPYRIGDKLTILDSILIDGNAKGISTDLESVPNDASSEKLFASGEAHRVTVTATFKPANDSVSP